jgi:hypothetical protein
MELYYNSLSLSDRVAILEKRGQFCDVLAKLLKDPLPMNWISDACHIRDAMRT